MINGYRIMKKQKTFQIFIMLFVSLLLVVWGICFWRINHLYPKAELAQVKMNEPIQCEAYTVILNEASIVDTLALYEEYGITLIDPILPEKTIICSVTFIRNDSTLIESSRLDLTQLALVSGAWSNLANIDELFSVLNGEYTRLNSLFPNEQVTYILPFSLYADSFSNSSWEELNSREFSLELSLYPQKKEIVFKP